MKSHKKYHKKVNPQTGKPYTSLLDRWDNDTLYRFRMLCSHWTRDMMPSLQPLIETKILGDKPSHRSGEQIRAATSTYVTNPELPSEGNAWAEAEHYRSPDWDHIKAKRTPFREGMALAREGAPVTPWVATVLQEHFGMDDVQALEEETEDGEEQPSASTGEGQPSAGSGKGKGEKGGWWSTTTNWTS
jgi:hypothetical protein